MDSLNVPLVAFCLRELPVPSWSWKRIIYWKPACRSLKELRNSELNCQYACEKVARRAEAQIQNRNANRKSC